MDTLARIRAIVASGIDPQSKIDRIAAALADHVEPAPPPKPAKKGPPAE